MLLSKVLRAPSSSFARYEKNVSPCLDAPRAYPLVPRYEQFGVRRSPFGQFLIFYRVGDDAVEVIHILHGARGYEALLFPEE